jgi:replicative DNA helicase/5S rRNA maturation endonuclease (ribonuclease M5)
MSHAGCPNRLYVAGDPNATEVFVVEGEKDADNLHSITGKTAASAENGAQTAADAQSKWKQVYTDQLAGKNVIILHDNDTAGRVFAKLEADSIATKAASVRVVDIATVWKECPEKGDVSDMIQALGKQETLNRLQTLISNAPIWKITLDFPEIAPGVLDGIEGYDEVDVSDGDRTPEQPPQPSEPEEQKVFPGVKTFMNFLTKIQTETYRPYPTGMQSFDEMLGGGVPRQALVMLTAAPGAGKTALVQQLSEVMAANGSNVLFLNLEMSREQLMARSLSRIIFRYGKQMSATDVMRGYKWTEEQAELVRCASEEYRERVADRIWYNPVDTTDLTKILDAIRKVADLYKSKGQAAPVVVLDYLHLLTTENRDEQAELLKKAVAGLKQYAIDYDTFVFAITASNRDSNMRGVQSLGSGRDTSAIEYSADIMLGLNYRELAEPWKKENQKKNGKKYVASDPEDQRRLAQMKPRHIVVQVLKNRMGEAGNKMYFDFHSRYSCFIPIDTKATEPEDVEVLEDDAEFSDLDLDDML